MPELGNWLLWLAGLATAYSIMIQEKKGMLKIWNMVLIILTFELCIFGTFITRSGIISSVHAFIAFALSIFVTATIMQEFYRGV
jgi:cytochrome c-type biogenesis protein CcmF